MKWWWLCVHVVRWDVEVVTLSGGINENTNKFIFTVWFTNYVNICNAALKNAEITYATYIHVSVLHIRHTHTFVVHILHVFYVGTYTVRQKFECFGIEMK